MKDDQRRFNHTGSPAIGRSASASRHPVKLQYKVAIDPARMVFSATEEYLRRPRRDPRPSMRVYVDAEPFGRS